MTAAQKILDTAIMTDFSPRSPTNRFEAIKLDGSAPAVTTVKGCECFQKEGDVHVVFNFPKDGEYTSASACLWRTGRPGRGSHGVSAG